MLCTRTFKRLASNKYVFPTITQLQLTAHKRNVLDTGISRVSQTPRPMLLATNLCRQCSSSTTTPVVENAQKDESVLNRVLTKVGFKPNTKSRLKVSSHILYESVADKINYIAFFRDFNLPNTFNSWFLVTELHVWLLLLRAMAEGSESGEDGRFLRNCIVEAMWGDVNTRAKKLGSNNPSLTRKQIETLSEQFQAALIAYDEGLMSDDRVLASALWRRFFEMNCDDYVKIESLVNYVRQQSMMLDSLSREEFIIKPKIPWIDLDAVRN